MSSPQEAADHAAPPPAVFTNASSFNVDGTVASTDNPADADPGTPAVQHDIDVPESGDYDTYDTPDTSSDTFDTPTTAHRRTTF